MERKIGRQHMQLKHRRQNHNSSTPGWRNAFLRCVKKTCRRRVARGNGVSLTSPAAAPFAARASAGKLNPPPAPTVTAPAAGSKEMVPAIFRSACSRVVGSAACTCNPNPVSRRQGGVGIGGVVPVAVSADDIRWMLLCGSSGPKLYAVKLHAAVTE